MTNFDDTFKNDIITPFNFFKFSLFKKGIIGATLCLAGASSFFDEMGIMKHIWITGMASYLIFEVYKSVVLPKLLNQPIMKNSNFRANSFVIISTYIMGSCSGAGLLTAIFNILGISAACLLVFPILPSLFFPVITAIGSVVMAVLAFLSILHFTLSIPVAIILASISFYTFRNVFALKDLDDFDDEDTESLINLSDTPKTIQYKFTLFEFFKLTFSLLLTLATALVIIYWIILSINPFWMRAERISKYETLNRLPHDINLRVREVSSMADLKYYKTKLNSFPVVIKPSICTTNSRNVMKCDDYQCLKKYLNERITEGPLDDGKNGTLGAWVIQEFAPEQEGVVFYYKLPYMSTGSIKNIGIRQDSLKEAVDPTTNHSGTNLTSRYWPDKFRTDFSVKYLKYFDDLAGKIPGYTGGRFDIIMPADSVKELNNPRGISVLELNVFFLGCIEEKKGKSILDELRRLRTSLMQIFIGIVNIVAGYNFLNFWGIAMKVPELASRALMCGNHEHLFAKP